MKIHQQQVVLAEALTTKMPVWAELRQLGLVAFGVIFLALSSKLIVPMWPVPMTMSTFAVLTLGTVYGPRLGVATILAYLVCGAIGFDIFAGSSSSNNGLAYMVGPTAGYLLGYIPATIILGMAARAGWDRSLPRMVLALLAGNVIIYLPGLLWLGVLLGWDQPLLQWGLMPFLVGDALKLCLAACVLPIAWKILPGKLKGSA